MLKLPISVLESEYIEIIKATKSEHHKLAFMLGFESGCRISEIILLKKEDIDIKGKKILIRQGKGGKDRIVPLPKHFKPKHLSLIPLKCKQRALQISFKKICLKTGLIKSKPYIHFHCLRHGFATKLLESGMPINHVQLLLGHSDLKVTSIYTKANPKDALEKYQELF